MFHQQPAAHQHPQQQHQQQQLAQVQQLADLVQSQASGQQQIEASMQNLALGGEAVGANSGLPVGVQNTVNNFTINNNINQGLNNQFQQGGNLAPNGQVINNLNSLQNNLAAQMQTQVNNAGGSTPTQNVGVLPASFPMANLQISGHPSVQQGPVNS